MSTIPSRVKNINDILENINNQTLKPNKIFLNIPLKYNRFENQIISEKELNDIRKEAKNTFKKYAIMYDLYEGVKNKSGKGISKGGNVWKGTHNLKDICDNKYPNYPLWKLKDRILRACWKEEKCDECGFSEHRITDAKVPLVANLKDGNWEKGQRDYSLENIQLLCLNCFYLYVGNLNNRHKKI